MSLFKLSNDIFSLGLDAQELSVYAYLGSLPTNRYTLDGSATVCVKQSTIAEKCGIKAVQTVSKIISRLCVRELLEPIGRTVKANRHKGTYIYAVRHPEQKNGYFFIERRVFGMLSPRQMLVYLFLCKSFSSKLKICWNSYNDISAQIGMKREKVIQTINELTEMHLIFRIRKKAKENHRVFVDNHYLILFFKQGRILKGKKTARLLCESNRAAGSNPFEVSKLQVNYSTISAKSQAVSGNIFPVRGSPPD